VCFFVSTQLLTCSFLLLKSWESKVARSRVANFGFKEDNYYEEDGSEQNNNGSTENALQYSAEVKIIY
jgi:transcription initiation factor TFIIA large subunit